MSQPKKPADGQAERPAETVRDARKPYEKPAFTREQLFETMALACGKINTTITACRIVKKSS